MTKTLLKSLWITVFILLSTFVNAQFTVLNEGFESGAISSTWSQVNEKGSVNWTVESGTLLYPDGAKSGSYRAKFASTGSGSAIRTKLVSPLMDLTQYEDLGDPLVTFWYANVGYNSGTLFDTLRVYGRTSSTGSWALLKEITKTHEAWTLDTISLAAYVNVPTFQIAFEGAYGQGHGIVLDDIKVIATSLCSSAPSVFITDKTATSANVSWNASQYTIQSHIKVSSTEMLDMTQTADVLDQDTYGRSASLSALTPGVTYYVYVRNDCGLTDYSPWSLVKFKLNPEVTLPYTQDFEGVNVTNNTDYTNPLTPYTNLPTGWSYWMNKLDNKPDNTSFHQYLPYVGYGTGTSYNPSGATANKFLNVKSYMGSTSAAAMEAVAILPQLAVENLKNVVVTFDYRTPSYSYSPLIVGVVTDPDNQGSFTEIARISAHELGIATSTWVRVSVSFANYNGNAKYIAFKQTNVVNQLTGSIQTGSSTYMDNIVVDNAPACMTPNTLNVINITSTGARLLWSGNSSSYSVKVSSTPITDFTKTASVYDGTVSTNHVDLSSLLGSRSYYFYVKAECSTDWVGKTFRSACADSISNFPYVENFDALSWGMYSAVPCWNQVLGTNSSRPYVNNSTSTSAPLSLYFGGSTTSTQIAVLPKMALDAKKLQVSFNFTGSQTTSKVEVGIMSTLEESSFTVIRSFNPAAPNSFTEITLPLDSYTGEGKYIAFRVGGPGTSGNITLDDVIVEKIPTCRKPESIVISDFKKDNVKVSWVSTGSETTWNLEYGPIGFEPGKGQGTIVPATSTTHLLTGLAEATEYDIYVQANCAVDDQSDWRGPVSFRTLSSPANPVGYRHNFEDETENSKWAYIDASGNYWTIGSAKGSDKALFVSADKKSYAYNAAPAQNGWAYRTFEFNPGSYSIEFSWIGFGEGSYDFVRTFLVSPEVKLESGDYAAKVNSYSATPTDWINLAQRIDGTSYVNYLNKDSVTWKKSKVEFAIDKAGLYNVAYLWRQDGSGPSTPVPVAIDSISIDAVPCGMPSKLKVNTNLVPSSRAEISWYGSTEKYELKVTNKDLSSITNMKKIDGLTLASDTLVAWVQDHESNSVIVEGLTPGTKYYYYVRGICGTDTTLWVPESFQASCIYTTPFSQNFEGQTAIPSCWTRSGATSGTSILTAEQVFAGGVNSTTNTTGWSFRTNQASGFGTCEEFNNNAFLYATSYGAALRHWLYMPALAVNPGDSLQFKVAFVDYTNSSVCTRAATTNLADKFMVLVSADAGATWKPEDAVVWLNDTASTTLYAGYREVRRTKDICPKLTGKFIQVKLDLEKYAGKNIQVAFYVASTRASVTNKNTQILLDDIYVGPERCETPLDVTVTPSKTTADIDWTRSGKEVEWRVKVSTKVISNFEATANVLDTVVTSHPFTIKNLKPGYAYVAYVSASCSPTRHSDWTLAKNFNTLVETPVKVPYSENFDNYNTAISYSASSGFTPPHWHKVADEAADLKYVYLYNGSSSSPIDHTNNSYSSGAALGVKCWSDDIHATITPELSTSVDSLQVTFWAYSDIVNGQLEVGVNSDPTDITKTSIIEKIVIPEAKVWNKYTVTFDGYVGDTVYNEYVDENEVLVRDTVVNFGKHIIFGGNLPNKLQTIYIDDVVVDYMPECIAPTGLQTDTIESRKATLKWNKKGKNTQSYHLKVSSKLLKDPFTESGDVLDVMIVDETSREITGLSSDTKYYAYIQTNCGDKGNSVWSPVYQFRTVCDDIAPIPYKQDFSNLMNAEFPYCWEKKIYGTSNYAYVSETLLYNGLKSLWLSPNSSESYYLSLPKVNAKLDTLMIEFALRISSGALYVGASKNPQDSTTFVPVEKIESNGGVWKNYIVNLSGIPDTLPYITIKTVGSGSQYLADVNVFSSVCPRPNSLSASKMSDTTVDLVWAPHTGLETGFIVEYGPKGYAVGSGTKVSVTGESTTLTGLSPMTHYDVYIRTDCGADSHGYWRGPVSFRTTQVPATIPYDYGFSDVEENARWELVNGVETNHWMIGSGAFPNDTALYITNNGIDNEYAFKQSSVVMAARNFNFAVGKYNLSFDWRSKPNSSIDCLYAYLVPTDSVLTSLSKFSSAPSSWIKLTTSSGLSNNSQKKNYSTTFVVSNPGSYNLVYYWSSSSSTTVCANPPAAIDNIKVTFNECSEPRNLFAKPVVTGTEAQLSWQGGKDEWYLKVSTTQLTPEQLKNKSNVANVFDATVRSNPFVLGSLQPKTTYYYYLRTSCDKDSVWSAEGSFTTFYTPYSLPFAENFSTYGATTSVFGKSMDDWRRYQGLAANAFAGIKPTNYDYSTWERRNSDCALPGGHATLKVYSCYYSYSGEGSYTHTNKWIATPNMVISDANAKLTFTMALSRVTTDGYCSATYQCDPVVNTNNTDKQFMVMISKDGGYTWKKEDAIIWNNKKGAEAGQYEYNSIPFAGMKYSVDLSKYANDTVMIAFYGESTVINSSSAIHIDDVRVQRTIVKEITDGTCAGYSYLKHGFNIPASQVIASSTPYQYTRLSTGAQADTIYNLTLKVGDPITRVIEASICEGDAYNENGFNQSVAGTYVTYATSYWGCDSTTTLHLKVNKSYLIESSKTICKQQVPFTWRGKTLSTTGTYTDDLKTKLGCDSVYKLNLTVVDFFEHTITETICDNEPFNFAGKDYSVTGSYSHTFTSASGCDSIVTLNLTANPSYNRTLEVELCTGQSYTINGQTYTSTGIYNLPLQTKLGCDSIIKLELTFSDEIYTMINDTIDEGEIYNKHGFTGLYETGIYTDTIASSGGCDSIIVLNLEVTVGDALVLVKSDQFTMAPNPVVRGGNVLVNYNFTAEEQSGLKVEIFNSIGVLLDVHYPDTYPLTIKGFHTSGYYLIRISTGTGKSLIGKLLVR